MNALKTLLELPIEEKSRLGLLYTPAEIAQQPSTWKSTFALFRKSVPELEEFLSCCGLLAELHERPTVFLVGAGSSDYVGRSLVQLLRMQWQCDVVAVPSTDLLTDFDDLVLPDRKYLWISFSRSGESSEGVAVLERALTQRPEIRHVVVSCARSGRMLRETVKDPRVFGICLSDSVNDRALAMTSSFSNLVILGQCLGYIRQLTAYEEVLERLVTAAEDLLEVGPDVAAGIAANRPLHVCFVGAGPLRAVAMESALKVLELTAGKTQTMSESALGFRHGPMAALQRNNVFVTGKCACRQEIVDRRCNVRFDGRSDLAAIVFLFNG